jgi:hypothetical protein
LEQGLLSGNYSAFFNTLCSRVKEILRFTHPLRPSRRRSVKSVSKILGAADQGKNQMPLPAADCGSPIITAMPCKLWAHPKWPASVISDLAESSEFHACLPGSPLNM